MKKIAIFLSLMALLVLSGCAQTYAPENRICVSVRQADGFTVENNGQMIAPGEDAVFFLRMEADSALVGVDYPDALHRILSDGRVELTMKAVQYPTKVSLELTHTFATISYDDGAGNCVTVTYDTSVRSRPNTSNGVGLFERPGYTLESWNTRADGSGQRIGLGSRVTVADSIVLYAQWAKWSDEGDFDWDVTEDGAIVTGYHGQDSIVTIPASYQGKPVTTIATAAFRLCAMKEVILPSTMVTVEKAAFQTCKMEAITLFDNIESISDQSFGGCKELRCLRINAVEKPYGALYSRESLYADKVDLLLDAQGQKKIVFYAGSSMWFNLDCSQLTPLMDMGYRPINMGVNAFINSAFQMQVMEHFVEPGDIFFHAPEITSTTQMMLQVSMDKHDDMLWCGLEYNYDLVSLVDMRTIPRILDTFTEYLNKKKGSTDYNAVYTKDGLTFLDEYGSVPFYRGEAQYIEPSDVYLDLYSINDDAMALLESYYARFQNKGARVYMSCACIDIDRVPEDQLGNMEYLEALLREAMDAMDGPILISSLEDYIYYDSDFYDSNYHLLSEKARENTQRWLRDLKAQMILDGLWEEA